MKITGLISDTSKKMFAKLIEHPLYYEYSGMICFYTFFLIFRGLIKNSNSWIFLIQYIFTPCMIVYYSGRQLYQLSEDELLVIMLSLIHI